jgi:hypothetical protein
LWLNLRVGAAGGALAGSSEENILYRYPYLHMDIPFKFKGLVSEVDSSLE